MATITLETGKRYKLENMQFCGWLDANGRAIRNDDGHGYDVYDYFDDGFRYKGPDVYGIVPTFEAETVHEVDDAYVAVNLGLEIGRAIAKDYISDGEPLNWSGINDQDGDMLTAAGITPECQILWDAAEATARAGFLVACRRHAMATGHEHGRAVPCDPASSEQAWSDWRAQTDIISDDPDLPECYVRGHMAGQQGDDVPRLGDDDDGL